MEYLQGILFTSKYIFGRDGNLDMMYLFAAFAILFYLVMRRDKLGLILKLSIPFALVCAIMSFLYPGINVIRCWIFFAKMVLNITFMCFVAYNCKKWRFIRFAETVAWVHAIETFFALLLPNSSLWVSDSLLNGMDAVKRLRLFYMDAGSLAFASGLVLVIIVYYLLTEDVIWRLVIAGLVMVANLYMSYGFGGIVCAFIAVDATLILTCIHKIRISGNKKKKIKKYSIAVSVVTVATIVSIAANSIYSERVKAIAGGLDYSTNIKVIMPLKNISSVLFKTKFLGVGFGNANTVHALNILGADKAYPNSFIRIIAEGGIFGIILVLICIGLIGYYCVRYGGLLDKALFIYITIFQMTGGYFTDPTNFFVYGWIIGDCLYNKVSITGGSFVKIFRPERKEVLHQASIGQKRIPSFEGGVEVVVEEIGKRLVKLGHQVDIYNRSGDNVAGSEYNLVDYANLKEYEGMKIITIPTIQRKGFAAFVYSFFASIKVVFSNCDVVHYHAEGPCAFIWIPSLFGIRTVATIHGLDWQRSGKWGSVASNVIKFGEKMAVEFADEIIVLSKHVRQYFLESYNRETVYIPNGVNRPVVREADEIKDRWNLEKDGYFLSLSRLTKEKKVEVLIEAYKKINTDKKLVIAGGSSDTEDYVKELRDIAGDDERIIFTGFVQGTLKDELYSNAYVYVIPSELEGMPISLLEAMSFGNCCLTSDIPENISVTRSKGLSFETNNVEELSTVMQELSDKPEVVAKYKSEAADYICGKYNWDEVVEKTIELYRRK